MPAVAVALGQTAAVQTSGTQQSSATQGSAAHTWEEGWLAPGQVSLKEAQVGLVALTQQISSSQPSRAQAVTCWADRVRGA